MDILTGNTARQLPEIVTSLTSTQLESVLTEANRRGRVSEIDWIDDGRFRISIASRPIVTHLFGTVQETDDDRRRIRFRIGLNHKALWTTLIITILSIILGPLSTEYFIRIYSWYWQPPLYILSALWIGLAWPRKSLRDGDPLVRKVIILIEDRIGASERAKAINAA